MKFHENQVFQHDQKIKSHKLSAELSGKVNDSSLKGYRKCNVS